MALSGARSDFRPFSTEDFRGYQRVRILQLRPVQLKITSILRFPVIVDQFRSNLMNNNYAQSAIFSPSDQNFPTESLMIESQPEMDNEIYAELDLFHLAKRRKTASVRPLIDRRQDVYTLQPAHPIEIIKIE